MGVTVTLEWYEQLFAGFVGWMRFIEGQRLGVTKQRHDPNGEIIPTDIEAAAAELAAAKVLNIYWPCGVNTFKNRSDIGRHTEVRYTKYLSGKLRVGVNDHDDRPYVLVRGEFPTVEVVGWMLGRDAKQAHWRLFPEAFMVPANKLTPITQWVARPNEPNAESSRDLPGA